MLDSRGWAIVIECIITTYNNPERDSNSFLAAHSRDDNIASTSDRL